MEELDLKQISEASREFVAVLDDFENKTDEVLKLRSRMGVVANAIIGDLTHDVGEYLRVVEECKRYALAHFNHSDWAKRFDSALLEQPIAVVHNAYVGYALKVMGMELESGEGSYEDGSQVRLIKIDFNLLDRNGNPKLQVMHPDIFTTSLKNVKAALNRQIPNLHREHKMRHIGFTKQIEVAIADMAAYETQHDDKNSLRIFTLRKAGLIITAERISHKSRYHKIVSVLLNNA